MDEMTPIAHLDHGPRRNRSLWTCPVTLVACKWAQLPSYIPVSTRGHKYKGTCWVWWWPVGHWGHVKGGPREDDREGNTCRAGDWQWARPESAERTPPAVEEAASLVLLSVKWKWGHGWRFMGKTQLALVNLLGLWALDAIKNRQ